MTNVDGKFQPIGIVNRKKNSSFCYRNAGLTESKQRFNIHWK